MISGGGLGLSQKVHRLRSLRCSFTRTETPKGHLGVACGTPFHFRDLKLFTSLSGKARTIHGPRNNSSTTGLRCTRTLPSHLIMVHRLLVRTWT